jgi:hypothetical protein
MRNARIAIGSLIGLMNTLMMLNDFVLNADLKRPLKRSDLCNALNAFGSLSSPRSTQS